MPGSLDTPPWIRESKGRGTASRIKTRGVPVIWVHPPGRNQGRGEQRITDVIPGRSEGRETFTILPATSRMTTMHNQPKIAPTLISTVVVAPALVVADLLKWNRLLMAGFPSKTSLHSIHRPETADFLDPFWPNDCNRLTQSRK